MGSSAWSFNFRDLRVSVVDFGLRAEPALCRYDWSRARRGRYAKRRLRTARTILVDPDVYDYFGGADEINEALRTLIRLSAVVRAGARTRRTRAA
jgi:hypothetical protein